MADTTPDGRLEVGMTASLRAARQVSQVSANQGTLSANPETAV